MPTPSELDEAEVLKRFGISKVLAHHYRYRDWRYSNLEDAVAQAKRDLASSSR